MSEPAVELVVLGTFWLVAPDMARFAGSFRMWEMTHAETSAVSPGIMIDSIRAVSRSLPFDVDDYDEVNRVFARWAAHGDSTDLRAIEIWTYCYVHRFFALQFLRSSGWMRSDADRLIDVTLTRLRKARYQLRNPGLYTFWVQSACRNAYATYVRSKRVDGLEDPESLVSEPVVSIQYDVNAMYQALDSAIERLPEFLRETARLRLVEGRPYRELAERTGRPVATLRSYANRALAALRRDPAICRIFGEMRDG